MAEAQQPDPSAAIALEATLKEFDNPEPGSSFEDVIKELDAAAAAEEAPTKEPDDPDPDPKDAPAAEAGDDDAAEDEDEPVEDEDFPADLTGEDPEPEDEVEDEPVEDEAPKGLSKKGKVDWKAQAAAKKEVTAQLQEVRKEKDGLTAEIATLRKQVAELPELREKVKYVDDAEKELSISRVVGTRDFKENIAAPLDAIEEQAIAIAKLNDVGSDSLFDAMAEPDPVERRKLLKAVTEDMDSMDRAEVLQMSKDTQVLLAKRHDIRSKASEAAKEAAENAEVQQSQASEKAKAEFVVASDRVVSELKKRVPFVELAEGETAEGVFDIMAERLKGTDFESLTPDRKAYAVASGLLVPKMTKQLAVANEKISKLESRLSRKNRAKPSMGGDAPAPKAGEDFGGDVEGAVADFFGQSQRIPLAEVLKNIG